MNFFDKLGSQVGLALDETILVMTMLSGFAGFVVVADPLDIFSGSRSTTELVSELQEIEMANYEFYRRYLSWPHETTDGTWKDNLAVLQGNRAMRPYFRTSAYNDANFLPEYKKNNGAVQHKWGDGGDITQHVVEHEGEQYLEVIFENVPYDTAYDIDEKVDGKFDPNNGRVFIMFDGDKTNLHYRANKVL